MDSRKIVFSLDNILRWIARYASINILAVVYICMGLIIVGFFPSIVATLSVVRKLIKNQNEEINILKTFHYYFKKEFIKANILGYILLVIGLILYINFLSIVKLENDVWMVSILFYYFIILLYVIVILWAFPLLVEYENNVFKHIKNAIVIGLTKINYTVSILLCLCLNIFVSLKFPGVIPFFTISLGCLIWYKLAIKVFLTLGNNT